PEFYNITLPGFTRCSHPSVASFHETIITSSVFVVLFFVLFCGFLVFWGVVLVGLVLFFILYVFFLVVLFLVLFVVYFFK
ncbi:hypothetical protein ACXHX3_19315, partial [Bacillus velezensis]